MHKCKNKQFIHIALIHEWCFLPKANRNIFCQFFFSVTHWWIWSEQAVVLIFPGSLSFSCKLTRNFVKYTCSTQCLFSIALFALFGTKCALLRSKLYCLKCTVSKMRLHWIILEFYIDFYFEYEFLFVCLLFLFVFFFSTAIQSTVKKSYFQRFLGGTIITRRSIYRFFIFRRRKKKLLNSTNKDSLLYTNYKRDHTTMGSNGKPKWNDEFSMRLPAIAKSNKLYTIFFFIFSSHWHQVSTKCCEHTNFCFDFRFFSVEWSLFSNGKILYIRIAHTIVLTEYINWWYLLEWIRGKMFNNNAWTKIQWKDRQGEKKPSRTRHT